MSTAWTHELSCPALPSGEVHVWRSSIPAAPGATDELERLLDADERARAARFRFDQDRSAFVFRWGALRTLLARYLDTDASRLRFNRTRGGKPFLAGALNSSDVRFSLARSGSAAVFAIARARNVGVDVERVKGNIDVVPIAREVFSEPDLARLMALPRARRTETFYAGWSRREAVVKADGTGVSGSLTRIDVWPPAGPGPTEAGICEIRTDTGLWSLLDLELGPHYRGALAAEGRIRRIQCQSLPDVICR